MSQQFCYEISIWQICYLINFFVFFLFYFYLLNMTPWLVWKSTELFVANGSAFTSFSIWLTSNSTSQLSTHSDILYSSLQIELFKSNRFHLIALIRHMISPIELEIIQKFPFRPFPSVKIKSSGTSESCSRASVGTCRCGLQLDEISIER